MCILICSRPPAPVDIHQPASETVGVNKYSMHSHFWRFHLYHFRCVNGKPSWQQPWTTACWGLSPSVRVSGQVGSWAGLGARSACCWSGGGRGSRPSKASLIGCVSITSCYWNHGNRRMLLSLQVVFFLLDESNTNLECHNWLLCDIVIHYAVFILFPVECWDMFPNKHLKAVTISVVNFVIEGISFQFRNMTEIEHYWISVIPTVKTFNLKILVQCSDTS